MDFVVAGHILDEKYFGDELEKLGRAMRMGVPKPKKGKKKTSQGEAKKGKKKTRQGEVKR